MSIADDDILLSFVDKAAKLAQEAEFHTKRARLRSNEECAADANKAKACAEAANAYAAAAKARYCLLKGDKW